MSALDIDLRTILPQSWPSRNCLAVMPVLHRRRQFYSLFPGLLLAPEEAQGAGEEVWARVEKGMRGHFGMAWTQGPEVIFH